MADESRSGTVIPGLRAAVAESFWDDSEVIDARLKIEGGDPDEMALCNSSQVHARSMRMKAEQIRAGEPLVIELRRVRRVADIDQLPVWALDAYIDPRTGVVITDGDTLRRADPRASVHT